MTGAAGERTLRGRKGTWELAKRRWDIQLDGRSHVVELDHSELSGRAHVRVNGQMALDQRARSLRDLLALTSLPTGHPFAIDGHSCALRVDPAGLTYGYDLIVDGISQRTGRRATPPPWESAPPRAVNVTAALLVLSGAVIGVPLVALAAWRPAVASGQIYGLVILALFAAAAWGVRARVREAWWAALLGTTGFTLATVAAFIVGLARDLSYVDLALTRSIAAVFGPYAILAWTALSVLVALATAVALLSGSVRRTLTFAAAPPLSAVWPDREGSEDT